MAKRGYAEMVWDFTVEGDKEARKKFQQMGEAAERADDKVDDLASSMGGRSMGRGRGRAGRAGKGMAEAARQASTASTDLTRVLSDMPYGIVAVRNNVEQLVGSFGRTVKSAGGVKAGLRAVAGSLTGVGGVMLGVTAVMIVLERFGPQIKKAFQDEGQQAAEALKKSVKELKKEFEETNKAFAEFVKHGRTLNETERTRDALQARQAELLAKRAKLQDQINRGLDQSGQAAGQLNLVNKQLKDVTEDLHMAEEVLRKGRQMDNMKAQTKYEEGLVKAREEQAEKTARLREQERKLYEERVKRMKEISEKYIQAGGATPAAWETQRGTMDRRFGHLFAGAGDAAASLPDSGEGAFKAADAAREQIKLEEQLGAQLKINTSFLQQRAAVMAAGAMLSGKSFQKIAVSLGLEAAKLIINIKLLEKRNKLLAAGDMAGPGGFLGFAGMLLGGFASGGIVGRTGRYRVGERGPEDVILPKGSRVLSNRETMQSGGETNLYIDGQLVARSIERSRNRASRGGVGYGR